jgi:hypothetical protein
VPPMGEEPRADPLGRAAPLANDHKPR